jgi:hypothetical protein
MYIGAAAQMKKAKKNEMTAAAIYLAGVSQ